MSAELALIDSNVLLYALCPHAVIAGITWDFRAVARSV